MRMIKHLLKILRDSTIFNPGIQSMPSGIVSAEKSAARAKRGKA